MEERNNTVSVIIPSYNSASYIEATLASVFAQTVPPLEILVIDDGSTDETISKIQALCLKHPEIRFYENEKNAGVSFTRNRGVALAKGDWIAFLDSDDLWAPDKLEKQLTFLQQNHGVFGFRGSSFIDEQGQAYQGYLAAPKTVNRSALLRQNVISCSSVLIRKDLMERYPMKQGEIHEDFDAWLRILEEVPVAFGLNEPLLMYRISRNSKSGNKFESFRMNYRTYRSVGLNPVQACIQMYWYSINGLKKYKNIKK